MKTVQNVMPSPAGRALLSVLFVLIALAAPARAFHIFPFEDMGVEEDLANGLQFCFPYPEGPYLFLTTEDGFQYYDFDSEEWVDRTWPGWIGRQCYGVTAIPGRPGHLALGGENAFFKGVLRLSQDMGASDDFIYESDGGRVTSIVATLYPDTTIFACTWSDVASGELLRSDDDGQSYQLITGHGHHAMTAIQAPSSTEIYVSGDNYIARTLDGGTTWENLQGNLADGNGIYCLLVPPMITALPDNSMEKGQQVDPFIEASFLMASNDYGLHITSAHNIDWELILPFPCRAVAYTFVQADTFVYWSEYYAVTYDGRLMICLDGNWDNWVDATHMIGDATPIDVVTSYGSVFVATADDGVYVSAGIDGLSPVPPVKPGLTLQAHPNPFNPVTEFSFSVPGNGTAVIDIFDLAGRKVERVFEGDLEAGGHMTTWQPRGLASGIYHAVLKQGHNQVVTRVSLIK